MTIAEFWHQVYNGTPGIYLYFSATVRDLEEVEKDIPKDFTDWLAASDMDVDANVWMGHGGITAGTHYDASPNFFVQFFGRKTFILSPPSEHFKIHVHPYLHPRARQSQIDFLNPDLNKFPTFTPVEGYEAILEPGDVLYIPNSWFHRVTAIDVSISMNVWCTTPDTLLDGEFRRSQKELLKGWKNSQGDHMQTFTQYIRQLIDAIKGKDGEWKPFVSKMIATRYLPIFGPAQLNKFECGTSNLEDLKDQQKILHYIETGASIVKKDPSVGIQETILLDFIEESATYLWSIANLNYYLQTCLQ